MYTSCQLRDEDIEVGLLSLLLLLLRLFVRLCCWCGIPGGRERIRYDPVPVAAAAAAVVTADSRTNKKRTTEKTIDIFFFFFFFSVELLLLLFKLVLVNVNIGEIGYNELRSPGAVSFLIVARVVDAAGCGARQIQQQPLRAHARRLRPIRTASAG